LQFHDYFHSPEFLQKFVCWFGRKPVVYNFISKLSNYDKKEAKKKNPKKFIECDRSLVKMPYSNRFFNIGIVRKKFNLK
jgi:hypothetical protein